MFVRTLRTLLAATILVAATAPVVLASTVHLDGRFTQHFGGLRGDGPNCSVEVLNCGTGMIAGYGKATDAFVVDEFDRFLYTVTLSDGSALTSVLEFADARTPGRSGAAIGAAVSFGNPARLVFEATVLSGTGAFAGATGSGTATLEVAGNVDQIRLELELVLL